MKKIFLSLATFLITMYAYSCSCRPFLGSYFLNQVEKFDAVVEGKFYRDPNSWKGYLILNKVYKGAISNDTIEIHEGGTDCTEIFDENRNDTYILGLNKFTGNNKSETYIAPSCVTSVLTVKDNFVFSDYNFHISNPGISFFKTKMRKEKLIKKIKTRS